MVLRWLSRSKARELKLFLLGSLLPQFHRQILWKWWPDANQAVEMASLLDDGASALTVAISGTSSLSAS